VIAVPRLQHRAFRSFWASGTGWGEFSYKPGSRGGTFFMLRVLAGNLRCQSIEITAAGSKTRLRVGDTEYTHSATRNATSTRFTADKTFVIGEGQELTIEALG
jgi:hypothetical protein